MQPTIRTDRTCWDNVEFSLGCSLCSHTSSAGVCIRRSVLLACQCSRIAIFPGVVSENEGCGAQIADHLDKNRRKTAVVTEVVCTLGRLAMRTILINAMHQPDPCPRTSARPLDPLGTTNTQFLHNLARNFPTTHSNLETRTLIFHRFQGDAPEHASGNCM